MKHFFSKNAKAQAYPWRLFALYSVLGVLAAVSILPYLLSLLNLSGNPLPIPLRQVVTEQILQSAIILLPAVGLGFLMAKKVKLGSPYAQALVYKKKMPGGFGKIVVLSLALGFLTSVLIAIADLLFIRDEVLSNIGQVNAIPVAWRLLTAFYGGIDEEILMRLFFMTLVAWIGWKIRKSPEKGPSKIVLWTALGLSTLLFGLSHLPVTSTLTDVNAFVLLRALVLNGIGGAVFGWLYWKKGFEAAMLSHFAADITLQVIVPTVIGMLAA
jgi:hypothetical protein